MIDILKTPPLRIEKIKNRKVYIFNCFECGKNEIRPEHKYLKKQKRRKQKSFNLTFNEFLEFTKIKNCHYCNSPIKWVKHTGKGCYRYNLDRKDSSKGYSKQNCVVCCKRCNYMKGSEFSYKEFKEVVKLINTMRNGDFII